MQAYARRQTKTPPSHRSADNARPEQARPSAPNLPVIKEIESLKSTPVNLSDVMEARLAARFGAPLGGLRVFEDEGLGDMGQRGYARGNEIHLAEGELGRRGDEVLLHEAGHVVQSGMGLVGGTGGILESATLESQASEGLAAPQSFTMPTSASGPALGFLGWGKKKNLAASNKARAEGDLTFDPAAAEPEEGNIASRFFKSIGRKFIARPTTFVMKKLTALKRAMFGYGERDVDRMMSAQRREKLYNYAGTETGDAKLYSDENVLSSEKISKITNADSKKAAEKKGDSIWEGYKATGAPIGNFLANTLGSNAAMAVNTVGAKFDNSTFGGLKDVVEGKTRSGVGQGFGIAQGSLGALGAGMTAIADIGKANTSRRAGNTMGEIESAFDVQRDIIGASTSALSATGNALGTSAGGVMRAIPALNAVSGGLQASKGVADIYRGVKTDKNMSAGINSLMPDSAKSDPSIAFSDEQRLKLVRTLQMARAMGNITAESGVFDSVAGVLNIAGGAASASVIGSSVGMALSGAGALVGAIGGMNKSESIDEMRDRVVEHELGLGEETKKLADEYLQIGVQPPDQETLERVALIQMGYNSGTKREVFDNIAVNRAKLMTDMANTRSRGVRKAGLDESVHGEEKYTFDNENDLNEYRQRKFARKLLKDMGLSKRKIGVRQKDDGKQKDVKGYMMQGVVEKLGMDQGVDYRKQLIDSRGKAPKEQQDPRQEIVDKIARMKRGTRFKTTRDIEKLKRKLEVYNAAMGSPQPHESPPPSMPDFDLSL
ncbi:MAG: DUF4157 domain-containing protein [Oscillospiraceae bacterium]|jgi:hypothetical protein|nr:DUF4157 domain-containing protein [Oscillospiraceae bacterium]